MAALNRAVTLAASALVLITSAAGAQPSAQPDPRVEDYYRIIDIPTPEGVELEVGGLAVLPSGQLAVSTRYGEVWMIDNPSGERGAPYYRLFANGLHESLGLAWKDGALYSAQRGELTRLEDRDGDGVADRYETVYDWPLSGHYHEYSFGPKVAPDGDLFVTTNVAFSDSAWWRAESRVPWRGWTLRINDDGTVTPWAAGMRSPAGLGMVDGDFFYSDNQGDWVGSGFIKHLEKGDFSGHPASLAWTGEPGSPLDMTADDLYDIVDPRFPAEGETPQMLANREDEPLVTLADVAAKLPATKLPAAWLPHGILGVSTSEIIQDDTGGGFGPFTGQVFVGDQGRSSITRVFLEKVNGVYQGAAFPFIEGFDSGVLRLAWGPGGDLYVGQTSRGWGSTGPEPFGLQRVVWTGETPFEMKAVRAMPDGFEVEFTRPVDPESAREAGYSVTSFTYKHHPVYGSPVVDDRQETIRGAVLSDDDTRVRLVVDAPRRYYVHELKIDGIRAAGSGEPLLHDAAYVTLNEIPAGRPVPENDWMEVRGAGDTATATTAADTVSPDAQNAASTATVPADERRMTTLPGGWDGVDATLSLGTVPGMQFDKTELRVAAGSRVALEFNNNDDMMHNVLVVAPGAADRVGQAALQMGLEGPKNDYVPASADVLAHTALVGPGAAETIYFTAPETPGRYEFVCTFPGHYLTMRGVLVVE